MKIKIIKNPLKEWAVELGEYLERTYKESIVEKGEDISLIIGGDGTLLYHKNNIDGIAILIGSETSKRAHINAGNKMSKEAVKEKIDRLVKSPSYVELNFIEGKAKNIYEGINDVVIVSNDHKVVETEIENMYFKEKDIGDGIIISTPFGSLGYNKSVGGSEVKLNVKALSLSFISSINRKIPIVFPPVETIIRVRGNADLVVDGEVKECNVEKVIVKYSRKNIKYYYKPGVNR